MSTSSHVFVSYVREDRQAVDRLAAQLRQAGVQVWLDREQIQPGQRWQSAIASAIENGAFFIACFSKAYEARVSSYVNEEITLAIDELRRRPTNRAWFIPVLLSGGTVPDRRIGAGETLRNIQWVDFDSDWNGGLQRLLAVIAPSALSPGQIVDRLNLQSWSAAQWHSLVVEMRAPLRPTRWEGIPCTAIVGDRCCAVLAEQLEEIVFTEAKEHGITGTTAELPRLAQQLALIRSAGELKVALAHRLKHSQPAACDSYRLLAALPIARYLNANFDELLSTALVSQHRVAVHETRSPGGIETDPRPRRPTAGLNRPTVASPLVYHVYGHLDDPDSLVVTTDDFRRFASESARDHSPGMLDLLQALANGVVLVVGFRFQDQTLQELLHFADARTVGSRNRFTSGWFVQISPLDEVRHLASRVPPLELLEASVEHCKAVRRYFTNRAIPVFWGTVEDFLSQLITNIEASAER